jgi:hypothetical protein
VTGRTLDELAQKINVPAAALRETGWRGTTLAAETGVDVDFWQGARPSSTGSTAIAAWPQSVHRRARHAAVPRHRGCTGRRSQ